MCHRALCSIVEGSCKNAPSTRREGAKVVTGRKARGKRTKSIRGERAGGSGGLQEGGATVQVTVSPPPIATGIGSD